MNSGRMSSRGVTTTGVSSRRRILTALEHREPDRVPIGFDCRPEIEAKILAHYGVESRLALFEKTGIDGFSVFTDSYVFPEYIGPPRPRHGDGSEADFFGIVIQKRWPLAFAEDVRDLDAYPWPEADWFDYSTIKDRCLELKRKGRITVGGEGGCGIYHSINLRGYEKALTDAYLNPKLAEAYLERMGDFFVEWNERWLAAAEGEFDVYRCGDEPGNSEMMLLAPDVWRKHYKPQLARVWAVARKHGLKIWFHCCGCCRPILEDIIEIGADMWDPAPAYVAGNDHRELKREYGDRLSFVGGVDLPTALVRGTPRDVVDDVKRCIDVLGPGGGYILGGSQALTDNVPLENAVAMFETALEYGLY